MASAQQWASRRRLDTARAPAPAGECGALTAFKQYMGDHEPASGAGIVDIP